MACISTDIEGRLLDLSDRGFGICGPGTNLYFSTKPNRLNVDGKAPSELFL